jgi:hypothetical protein
VDIANGNQMRLHHSESVPLWLVNTLLMNNVFGLPGGHEASMEITIGGIENMLWLANRIDQHPPWSSSPDSSSIEAMWLSFVEAETKKR